MFGNAPRRCGAIAKLRCQHLSISNGCFVKAEIGSDLGTMSLGGSLREAQRIPLRQSDVQ